MIASNIRSFAAGILHRCKCKCKPEYSLKELGLSGNNLTLFKETIEYNYKIAITEADIVSWNTLNDVINTVEAKVI